MTDTYYMCYAFCAYHIWPMTLIIVCWWIFLQSHLLPLCILDQKPWKQWICLFSRKTPSRSFVNSYFVSIAKLDIFSESTKFHLFFSSSGLIWDGESPPSVISEDVCLNAKPLHWHSFLHNSKVLPFGKHHVPDLTRQIVGAALSLNKFNWTL